LKVTCQDATGDDSISYSFKKRLNEAIKPMNLPKLNWGAGNWQRVAMLLESRKDYMHRFVKEVDLFPEATVADGAIDVGRSAIIDIYKHVNRPAPLGSRMMMPVFGTKGRERASATLQ